MSTNLQAARAEYEELLGQGLALDLQRGQPSDADFDLSNALLTAVTAESTLEDGFELRNYSAGTTAGLPSARALFADYLGVRPEQTFVWNNASLELQGLILGFAMLHGLPISSQGWAFGERPKMIVTVPGYDRHFLLLKTVGFDLVSVSMQADGPDLDEVTRLAADPAVKGTVFVPTYSNPTGDTISAEKAQALAAITAAAPDFTIFADDAYRGHHLTDAPDQVVNFVDLCAQAGHPDRAFVFGSTSKITFAGAGLGFVASSEANIAWLTKLVGAQSIGPNKVEQARHVRFLTSYPGGIPGLMTEHAKLVAPKFTAVDEALTEVLGADGGGYATWRLPKGGYFVSLDTADPVADRVVQLAKEAGIKVTPAGATFPGQDPANSNIRLAPTRPPLAEVEVAMRALATCIKLAAEEHRAG